MTDKRSGSEPGTGFDESQDSDEPAFEWMRGDARVGRHAAPPAGGRGGADGQAAAGADGLDAPGSERIEPSPTGMLNARPPEEDVQRRSAERDAAARAKPIAPRVLQVLMAALFPFLILIAAVRIVASPLFLWAEYHRPGFPGDGYGFSADDRLTYASYAVDYLANLSSSRYLGDLVFSNGDRLFTSGEVSHMADVKLVVLSAYGAGALVLLFFILAFFGLRKARGAFGRGLFAGSLVTVGLIAALTVLAFLGWEQFFTEFHRIFFADGTWTFRLEDTLIRLFPGQFWMDAAVTVGVLVLLTSVLVSIFCWPTPKRRASRAGAPVVPEGAES
ncbi:TIGR01906 family membrane protein [Sinomonas mesophila]|uniref:TIGR01906 family membrane protein n=1 Tax=Sinomonas mesophila TaxID=1531955 RepID=UPI001FEB8175|nr:TIGR01906 family membrane protein [Sinomonas mesophila]